jgi:hypothetical protein
MTAEPEPAVDDSYPSSWKPREARERDRALDPTAMELTVSAMSDSEFQAFVQRTRGDR